MALGRAFVAAALAAAVAIPAGAKDSILFTIVERCIDASVGNYCEASHCPKPQAGKCASAKTCEQTSRFHAINARHAVMRDIKSCKPGCPKNFLHALLIPRMRVSGVEDPARPPDAWTFAWESLPSILDDSGARLVPNGEEKDVVLLINPPAFRSQHQFHIHIARLKAGARQELMSLKPTPPLVDSLDEVWGAARAHAEQSGITGAAKFAFGVVVVQDASGKGFRVAAIEGSTEGRFSQHSCTEATN